MSQALTMAGYAAFSVTDALKPGAQLLKWMVLVSLFSWARDKDTKRYGWWGAAVRSQDEFFGSFLWKIERAKNTDATAVAAKAYIEQALAWMKRDKVVDDLLVVVERAGSRLSVDLSLIRDGETASVTFSDLWEAIRGS